MDPSHETRVQVASWALETLTTLGAEHLAADLTLQWARRFTSRLGDATYRHTPRMVRVRLSVPLWGRADARTQRETVIHEVCHLVQMAETRAANDVRILAGRPLLRHAAHGPEWRALMRRCGLTPQRCHNVDRTGLAKTKKTIRATCACGAHPVTPYVAGRIAAGVEYFCKRCKATIRVLEPVAPVAKKGGRRRRRAPVQQDVLDVIFGRGF